MLPLRTLLLLLLCLTSGMTATLGLYRSSSSEDTPAPEHPTLDAEAAGPPALDPAPVEALEAEGTVLTEDTPIAETLIGQEPPALEESVGDQSDQAASDTPLENEPIVDEPVADAPVSDSPLVEQPVEEDVHASDAADSLVAGEPVADSPLAEEPVADSPLAEEPVADSPLFENSPVVDAPAVEPHPAADTPDMAVLAEEPQGHNTPAAEEAPAGEALAEEAPGAELLDNEIEAIQEALEELALEDLALEDLAPSMRLPKVEESSWGMNSIRDSFQAVNGYFDSLVELVGGRNGVCQYTCLYGKAPVPRTGYQIPEPNGCSNSLLGLQFDMGIPAMTKCCDMLDTCYDTCGSSKSRCDNKFRWCVHGICSDLKRSLGFVSKVQACESMADALYNTVWSLGCRSYMSSQREACYCEGQERDEL